MVKCKYETSNGRCGLKDCYAYRHKCYTEEFCKFHQLQTNADHIRAMSDLELAKGIETVQSGTEIKNPKNIDYFDCILEWLKQPAE